MHSASRGCRCFSSGVLMSSCDRKSLFYNGGLSRCFNEAVGRACGIKKTIIVLHRIDELVLGLF